MTDHQIGWCVHNKDALDSITESIPVPQASRPAEAFNGMETSLLGCLSTPLHVQRTDTLPHLGSIPCVEGSVKGVVPLETGVRQDPSS